MVMEYIPFVTTGVNRTEDIIIVCDHATNTVPAEVACGDLGLCASEMQRHIAFDIGAASVSQHLGTLLNAPVICSDFSRLVIDPNRGEDDPTLLMRISDGSLIPANRYATRADLDLRLNLCYRPYHAEITRLLAAREQPAVISIHSFTAKLQGGPMRPWHIGILSNCDRRLSDPLLCELSCEADILTGDNVPYSGYLPGDTMDRHARGSGYLHTLIEVRNDLIAAPGQQKKWAGRLAPLIQSAISRARAGKEI